MVRERTRGGVRGVLPRLAVAAVLAAAPAMLCGPALAQNLLPSGGSVVSGSAKIRTPTKGALSITQTSPRAIINWNLFSIGPTNSVNFWQPSSSAAILNRVTSQTPSTIAGLLTGNGQVYLVNPNGIAITSTGLVRVDGGFVATTLDIANGDFMAGKLNFQGNGASAGAIYTFKDNEIFGNGTGVSGALTEDQRQ